MLIAPGLCVRPRAGCDHCISQVVNLRVCPPRLPTGQGGACLCVLTQLQSCGEAGTVIQPAQCQHSASHKLWRAYHAHIGNTVQLRNTQRLRSASAVSIPCFRPIVRSGLWPARSVLCGSPPLSCSFPPPLSCACTTRGLAAAQLDHNILLRTA